MNLTAQVESVFATVISDNPMKTQLVWFHLLTLTAEYSNWKTCIRFSYIKIGCYCISEQNAQLKAMLRLRVEMLLSYTSLWVWVCVGWRPGGLHYVIFICLISVSCFRNVGFLQSIWEKNPRICVGSEVVTEWVLLSPQVTYLFIFLKCSVMLIFPCYMSSSFFNPQRVGRGRGGEDKLTEEQEASDPTKLLFGGWGS